MPTKVWKLQMIGKSDLKGYSFVSPREALFRKDGATTVFFGRTLDRLMEDIEENGGMLTLRYDWNI